MNKPLRAHVFQHVPFEGIGSMAGWLEANRYHQTTTRFFSGETLPALDGIDLLIVMGGPMSVNDVNLLPWLAEEKQAITRAINQGIPVIGICLGAQLIASALGAKVYPNEQKEIGWFPVQAENRNVKTFTFPDEMIVFHWHGETFDLPDGALWLASSRGCRHQAFQFGATTIGLQFHLETTMESARELVENCRDELIPAPYVQAEEMIFAADTSRYAAINSLMAQVLEYVTHRNSR